MVSTYKLTPDAKSDLIEIRRYTKSKWGQEQAKKYLKGLQQALNLLAENPLLGVSRPEIGANIHSFPYASHVVYYLPQIDEIVVFAVLHKQMVPLRHIAGRDTN